MGDPRGHPGRLQTSSGIPSLAANFGATGKLHPCADCLLWEYVPQEYRNEDVPCHFIPLNARGDTISSLEARGDRERAERALLDWLDNTIRELEEKAAWRGAN